MNEHQLVDRIVEHLHQSFGSKATVLKFNDRITKGIPDLIVVRGGKATFLEVKWFSRQYPTEKELDKHVEKLQWERARRLADQGRCFYVCGYDDEGVPRLTVVGPWNVREFGNYHFGHRQSRDLKEDLEQLLTFL